MLGTFKLQGTVNLAVLIAMVSTSCGLVLACDCQPAPQTDALKEAALIFRGKVLAVRDMSEADRKLYGPSINLEKRDEVDFLI